MQCSNFRDAFVTVCDFNERLSSIPSAAHNLEISVDDLKQDCHTENTATCIARLADEWQQLDDIYVRQQHKVQGTGKRSSLVVPFDIKGTEMTPEVLNALSDERVSEVVKVEYFSKLSRLLQNATQAKSASDIAEAEDTVPSTVQNASNSLKRGVYFVPELAAAFSKQKKHHVLSQPEWDDMDGQVHDGDLIITVTVYSSDCKRNDPKQIIDILGCQSVQELCDAIYCVSCTLPEYPGVRDSGSANGDEDSFCCVEGDIFTALCRGASRSAAACCCTSSSAAASGTTTASGTPPSASVNAVRMMDWVKRTTLASVPHSSVDVPSAGPDGASAAAVDEAEMVLTQPASGSAAPAPYTGAKRGRKKKAVAVATTGQASQPADVSIPTPNVSSASPAARAAASLSSVQSAQSVDDVHSQQISADQEPLGDAQKGKRVRNKSTASSHTGNKEFRIRLPSGEKQLEIKCSKYLRCDCVDWQLGTPYLYAHNGCEHIFYVSNIRIYHEQHDASSVAAYPVETFRAKYKQRKCAVCEVLTAQYVVYGDRLAECSPCFYCAHCYHMLHYSADGQLLYDDFQVFPYVHDP